MKIYFAAHSTTTDNEDKIASGWKNVELSELGTKQSHELGERAKNMHFDLIACSDLQRATETVRLAFGDKYKVIADKRLRELNYGDFDGKPSSIVGPMKPQHISTPFPNGESYDQAMERCHEFYKELKEKHPDATVLVIGHRATQYGLDTLIDGKTLEDLLSTPFKWQPWWEYQY